MSTKIYNGYYIENCTVQELQDFVINFQIKIQGELKYICRNKIADICTTIIDLSYMEKSMVNFIKSVNHTYINTEPSHFPIYTALILVIERFKKKYPGYNFNCTVRFIPIKNKILCLLETKSDKFKEIWETTSGVYEYKYWNHTDKPNKFSDKEWLERGVDWKQALGLTDRCSQKGFVTECVIDLPLPYKPEEVLAYIPTPEERTERMAKFLVCSLKTKELAVSMTDCEFYEIYFKARQWLSSEEGQRMLNKKEESVFQKLKREITKEDLTKPYEEFYDTFYKKNLLAI